MDNNDEQKEASQGPFLVTLRVDELLHDKANDKYILCLHGCKPMKLEPADDNEEHKQPAPEISDQIKFEIMDNSKIIHIERGVFMPAASSQPLSNNDGNKQDTGKMVEILQETQYRTFTRSDKWFLLFWLLYIIVSVGVFIVIEGHTVVDALYFRIVTSFGVGFGDIVPETATGIMLNCVFIVLDMAKLAYIDWRVITWLLMYRKQKLHFNAVPMHLVRPHDQTDADDPNVADNDNVCSRFVNNRRFTAYVFVILFLFFLAGTMVMGLNEGYYWLDSIHWNFVTLAQIGYGDVAPHTIFGKLFVVFYIIFGYVVLLLLAVIIFDQFMSKIEDKNGKPTKVELTGLLSQ